MCRLGISAIGLEMKYLLIGMQKDLQSEKEQGLEDQFVIRLFVLQKRSRVPLDQVLASFSAAAPPHSEDGPGADLSSPIP